MSAEESKEHWREIAEQLSKETDPQKVALLARQLIEELDSQKKKPNVGVQPQDPVKAK